MNTKPSYILIYKDSLYRVESRYQSPYKYRGVALKHAERIYTRKLEDWTRNQWGEKPEQIIVVSTDEYKELIKDKGEWKQAIMGTPGTLVWVEFDTPACCDPSTETYASM